MLKWQMIVLIFDAEAADNSGGCWVILVQNRSIFVELLRSPQPQEGIHGYSESVSNMLMF